jgi:hypothetical protein
LALNGTVKEQNPYHSCEHDLNQDKPVDSFVYSYK